jgi:hypothetical protein
LALLYFGRLAYVVGKIQMCQNVRLRAWEKTGLCLLETLILTRLRVSANDLHVLRWLRYRSTELQTYYKFKKEIRTSKFTLNQQLAQTCC